nr:DMT family transporter [uncultured Acetobacterium sp.]
MNTTERLEQQELRHAKSGLGFGVVSGMTWGLSGVIMSIAFGMAPFTEGASLLVAPLVGAALHDGFAGFWVFLFNLFNGKWREYGRSLRTKPGMMVCLAAMFGGPIGMSGYMLGITLAGPSYALAITAIYPAIGAILSVIFLKEKIGVRTWIGILLSIMGVAIVSWVPPAAESFPYFYAGIALAFLAAIGWGTEGVISGFGMDMVDPEVAVGIREATSFVVYLVAVIPLLLGVVGYQMFFGAFTTASIGVIAMAALLGGGSYICWYTAINKTGASRAMALNITYALWSVFFSWLLLGTQITPTLIIGGLTIVAGAVLVGANPKELINLRKV